MFATAKCLLHVIVCENYFLNFIVKNRANFNKIISFNSKILYNNKNYCLFKKFLSITKLFVRVECKMKILYFAMKNFFN